MRMSQLKIQRQLPTVLLRCRREVEYTMHQKHYNPTDVLKFGLLIKRRTTESWNFRQNSIYTPKSILCVFRYPPWFAYFAVRKGSVAHYCILFPQPVAQGIQDTYIIKAWIKYKDQWSCKRELKKMALYSTVQIKMPLNFTITNRGQQLNKTYARTIHENQHKLAL